MRLIAAILIAPMLAGCWLFAPQPPDVTCEGGRPCTRVLSEAMPLLFERAESMPSKIVVGPGRAPGSRKHFEVHACFSDGRYLLVDVWDVAGTGRLEATLRADGWDDPPCD